MAYMNGIDVVWEWCKNVWYSNISIMLHTSHMFENDVKMYGTQTSGTVWEETYWFENDVKMYGTQTTTGAICCTAEFENDVKMYGTQTLVPSAVSGGCLRMM